MAPQGGEKQMCTFKSEPNQAPFTPYHLQGFPQVSIWEAPSLVE